MGTRVLVGMSGGVDSSVAALLLLRQGFEVEGATFLLSDTADVSAADDARAVCERLGVRHHLLDYRALFRSRVLDPFCASYLNGQTPNPCIFCNRSIKFGAFAKDACEMGFDKIATGHYAQVCFDETAGRWQLRRNPDSPKDQSYVLYHLDQRQLSMLLLPLAPYEKPQIRMLAAEAGLGVQSKSDSQDICFVPDGDYVSFIRAHTGCEPVPGDFIDEAGRVLGQHQGVLRYTIGQRKGLGISMGERRFVSRLNPSANTVTLSDEASIFKSSLLAEELRFSALDSLDRPMRVQAKIRYAHRPAPATVYPLADGRVRVDFDKPQRAITAGQAVVFYDGALVLGGGRITESTNARD